MYMWMSSDHTKWLANSALSGSMSSTRPPTRRKPVGLFIQALTATTMNEPVSPVMMIGMPHSRCRRGDMRPQP